MNRRYFIGAGLAFLSAPLMSSPTRAASTRSAKSATRTLSLHHLHTDERLTLTYRVGDNYQRSALQRLNHFLRDFRSGDSVAIDPRLYDLLYDVQRQLGGSDVVPYEILSAYRSPQTNAMLRRTSSGVARKSLHMSGKALDVRLADAPTRQIRDAALNLARGGVGYYPKSDFVHLDTGRVRRWGA